MKDKALNDKMLQIDITLWHSATKILQLFESTKENVQNTIECSTLATVSLMEKLEPQLSAAQTVNNFVFYEPKTITESQNSF